MRITVRIIKEVPSIAPGLKLGMEKNLRPDIARSLIKDGIAEEIGTTDAIVLNKDRRFVDEVKPKQTVTELTSNELPTDYKELKKLLPEDYDGSVKKKDIIAYLQSK